MAKIRFGWCRLCYREAWILCAGLRILETITSLDETEVSENLSTLFVKIEMTHSYSMSYSALHDSICLPRDRILEA